MKTLLLASSLALSGGPVLAAATQEPAKSQEDTLRDGGSVAAQYDGPAGERPGGAGVATGFVAAGFGLALIGLLVRRTGRHPDDHFDDADLPPTVRK